MLWEEGGLASQKELLPRPQFPHLCMGVGVAGASLSPLEQKGKELIFSPVVILVSQLSLKGGGYRGGAPPKSC